MCVSIAIILDDNAEPDEYFIINWVAPNAPNVIITPAVTNVTIESKYTLYMSCTCIVNTLIYLSCKVHDSCSDKLSCKKCLSFG